MGARTRKRINETAAVYVSAASTWELSIKAAIGKLTLPDDVAVVIDQSGLRDLPITRAHTLQSTLTGLPHKDPFDALLIAQAKAEKLTLLTADQKLLTAWPDAADARL